MFVVVWERAGGGGGHQVTLTEDRAEVVHRAISRAVPGADVRIEALEGFGPKVEPVTRATTRRPRKTATRTERPTRSRRRS